MVADGHTGSITNVDISTVITEYMRNKHADLRPSVTWEVGDVTRLAHGDSTFDAAIDKGTMDALMVSDRWPALRFAAHRSADACSRICTCGIVRQRLDRQHGRHGTRDAARAAARRRVHHGATRMRAYGCATVVS